MGYDKRQAAEEFARWSESYDRCVLQWLLFGPSHRALIKRIEAVAGRKPIKVLDIGCGTGLFASRLRAALPESQGRRPRPGVRDAGPGRATVAVPRRHGLPGPGGQRAPAVRRRVVRFHHLRQQLPPLPQPGSGGRRDASRPQARGPAPLDRRLPRRPLGLVHLRRLRHIPRGERPSRVVAAGSASCSTARGFRPWRRRSIAAPRRSCSTRPSPPSRSRPSRVRTSESGRRPRSPNARTLDTTKMKIRSS